MKKPVFIIAETFLSLVLAASLAAVAALAIDIKTDGSLIPPELYGGKSESSAPEKEASQESSKQEKKAESSEKKESSEKTEGSDKADTSQQTSKTESSAESRDKSTEGLILNAPEGLSKQPDDLSKFIGDYGYSFENLSFDHLIVVDPDENSAAKVYCYQKNENDLWWNIAGENNPLTDKGFVGEKGPDYDIKPGSKKSPLGFYSLGEGFYIGEKPDTTYPMFEITDDTYWLTDNGSAFYNTKVEGTDKKDWSSAEHMISLKDKYKYGIVVEYNTYNIDNSLAGSIFLQCGTTTTQGSIAVPEKTMKTILEWLDEDSKAYIYIIP